MINRYFKSFYFCQYILETTVNNAVMPKKKKPKTKNTPEPSLRSARVNSERTHKSKRSSKATDHPSSAISL